MPQQALEDEAGILADLETSDEPTEDDQSIVDQGADDLPQPSPNEATSWWKRPCGGKEVIFLALPLMISTFSYSLMQFCDRVFLGSHSKLSLAAVMPAGVMSWVLMSFPFGVALYTNVFVAQYFGAKQNKRLVMYCGTD